MVVYTKKQIFALKIGNVYMEKIGIFCSASDSIDKMYFEKTTQLGEWIGKNSKTLVYGGANLGLMDCMAQAVKKNGGTVIGVVPEKLEENGKVSDLLDKIYRTKNLSDRKDIIVEESDVLIALPGGVGTLDEIFHVMAAASIGYHQKKVIFYNINGFYNDLIKVLNSIESSRFTRHPLTTYFEVAENFEELTFLLNKCKND